MTNRQFTILSTGSLVLNESLPADNGDYPVSVPVEVISFIKIVLKEDDQTRNQILAFARKPLTVIFTSTNAAKAVIAVLDGIPDWEIYCVGRETRKQLLSFFSKSSVRDYADNAEDLSGRIIQQGRVKQAVFFCGDQRRDILPDKMKDHGIHLQELIVYRTLLTPVKLSKTYDGILFFSPTAVTSFFSVNTLSPQTILFALGGTTAAALRAASKNEVILSPKPDKMSLIQMAIAYGQSHPIS